MDRRVTQADLGLISSPKPAPEVKGPRPPIPRVPRESADLTNPQAPPPRLPGSRLTMKNPAQGLAEQGFGGPVC
jgi:hypothetical protein